MHDFLASELFCFFESIYMVNILIFYKYKNIIFLLENIIANIRPTFIFNPKLCGHFKLGGDFFLTFIEFVSALLRLYDFWAFGFDACGISASRPGVEPVPPALED